MGKDSRGVLRGRCNAPGCRCIEYTRETSDACSGCNHPPTKHLKLDRNSPSAGVSNVSPTFPSQPQTQPSYPSGAYSSGVLYGGQSQPSTVERQYYTPSLKACPAEGCHNKVHYDPELGPFDYCSPACRDRHLLPQERERLKKDIKEYSRKIADLPPLENPPTASPMTSASRNEMVRIKKESKQEIGIITAEVPDERGLLIVGFELGTPAYDEFKSGKIKLLDVITQLNEDDIDSKEEFQRSTRDKTIPLLTLERKRTTPSIKNLLTKVKDKFPLATHIRILMNPFQFGSGTKMIFGIEPVSIQDGYMLGVDDSPKSCAHLSGVTTRDIVFMYATMSIKECKFPGTNFKSDISKAQNDGKHLILVLKREDYVYST